MLNDVQHKAKIPTWGFCCLFFIVYGPSGQPMVNPASGPHPRICGRQQLRELLPGLFETCDTVTAVQPEGCLAVNKCTI